jgi:hypothetical protein
MANHMHNTNVRVAHSASAIGAGILGFGLGAFWGSALKNYALWIILVGAVIHVSGMIIVQYTNKLEKNTLMAKALWI